VELAKQKIARIKRDTSPFAIFEAVWNVWRYDVKNKILDWVEAESAAVANQKNIAVVAGLIEDSVRALQTGLSKVDPSIFDGLRKDFSDDEPEYTVAESGDINERIKSAKVAMNHAVAEFNECAAEVASCVRISTAAGERSMMCKACNAKSKLSALHVSAARTVLGQPAEVVREMLLEKVNAAIAELSQLDSRDMTMESYQ
jgi:hypothetical protein